MFGIGTSELMIVALIGLIVLGPERLPKAARFAGLWIRRARAQWYSVKSELERELAAEELKRSVQEAQRSIADAGTQLRDAGEHARSSLDEIRKSTEGLVADATRLNGDAAVDPRDPEAVTGPALPPEAIAGDPTCPPVAPIDDAEDARGAAR